VKRKDIDINQEFFGFLSKPMLLETGRKEERIASDTRVELPERT